MKSTHFLWGSQLFICDVFPISNKEDFLVHTLSHSLIHTLHHIPGVLCPARQGHHPVANPIEEAGGPLSSIRSGPSEQPFSSAVSGTPPCWTSCPESHSATQRSSLNRELSGEHSIKDTHSFWMDGGRCYTNRKTDDSEGLFPSGHRADGGSVAIPCRELIDWMGWAKGGLGWVWTVILGEAGWRKLSHS